MADKRTEFQRFTDFMKAIVKVPKSEVTAQRASDKAKRRENPEELPSAAKR